MRGRRGPAAFVAAVFLGSSACTTGPEPAEPDARWNVVVIVTDDQRADSLGRTPPAMPYLESAIADPREPWVLFDNGFASSPVCCPSRATLFTGLLPHDHGVSTNADGHRLDEDATVAAWLDDAGYHTGFAGKYLNGYPFGRGPYVPPGWDRWWGKQQGPQTSTYFDHTLIEDGRPVARGGDAPDYLTDVLADLAVGFVRDAPEDRPFLLWVAPTAPHPPWTPAPRHAGRFAGVAIDQGASVGEQDVSDKPAWVRALPRLGPFARASLRVDHRRSLETLLAVDDAVRRIVEAVRSRGVLDRTMIVVVSDNGFSFGEHRWVRKSCPYDECVRVPFLVRLPGAAGRIEDAPVATVDVAPTIADLAGVDPPGELAGRSLLPVLRDAGVERHAVVLESFDDRIVPPWRQLRTRSFSYVELDTGERELYDLRVDPQQLVNVVDRPAYATVAAGLADRLATALGA